MAKFRHTRTMYEARDSTIPFVAERIIEAPDKDAVEVAPGDKLESVSDDTPLYEWRVVHS